MEEPHHEQSSNQCYGKGVAGVRGPPLILLCWVRELCLQPQCAAQRASLQ